MTAWMLSLMLLAVPLVDAVRQQDSESVRALLEQGADVNAPEGDGATALHWAVYKNDAGLVDVLIGANAKVDVANDLAITPLHLASANGNAGIVATLLERGANPNAASGTGVTPLMEAARRGSSRVVRALLERDADVDAREAGRAQTALMWAVAERHPEVVRVLLEFHADVQARTEVRTVTAMLDRGPRRTVKTAMQDASQIGVGGSTALMFAAQAGDAESARLLLEAGADVDDTGADGRSALVLATFAGHSSVARVLLDAGASPDAAGAAGYTALHAAVLRGDLETVKALVARGAHLDARLTKGSPVRRFGSQWALPSTLTGATPLFVAATYLEVDILRTLLVGGARHALGLPDGTTPLLAAAGTAVEIETRPSDLERWHVVDSDSPRVPRSEADVLEAARLLLDAGADVNHANDVGDTALHAAAGAGMTSVIQLLADRGAALDVRNKDGETPLDLTLPKPPRREGLPPESEGFKAAEELLRRLAAEKGTVPYFKR